MSRLARPSLPAWAAFVACTILAVAMVATLLGTIGTWGFDFGGYWSAAHIPLREGWDHLYDRPAQDSAYRSLGLSHTGNPYVNHYIAPPPLIWLVLPLVALPFRVAAIIWSLLQLAAALGAWWIAAPPGAQRRAITLLALLGAFPVAYCIFWGQATGFLLLGLAASYAFIKHDRPVAAGLSLCLLVLKPQDMFLVPVVLLAAGHGRVFMAWLAGTVVLGALSLAVVGVSGIESLLSLQRSYIGGGAAGPFLTVGGLNLALVAAALATAGALAWARRTRDLATSFWLGITGSLAATPYIHEVDLMLLLAAGWIVLREREATWVPWFVAATWIAAELFLVAYPVLAFAGIAVWLGGAWLLSDSVGRAPGRRAAGEAALAPSSA